MLDTGQILDDLVPISRLEGGIFYRECSILVGAKRRSRLAGMLDAYRSVRDFLFREFESLIEKVSEPEIDVQSGCMSMPGPFYPVPLIRIYHHFKMLSQTLQILDQLNRILHMNIVIEGAMKGRSYR
jgi:hypothetical protein